MPNTNAGNIQKNSTNVSNEGKHPLSPFYKAFHALGESAQKVKSYAITEDQAKALDDLFFSLSQLSEIDNSTELHDDIVLYAMIGMYPGHDKDYIESIIAYLQHSRRVSNALYVLLTKDRLDV
jgi:hypothetical protein